MGSSFNNVYFKYLIMVFGPTPEIPGILSDASPNKALYIGKLIGWHPNIDRTSSTLTNIFFIGDQTCILELHN